MGRGRETKALPEEGVAESLLDRALMDGIAFRRGFMEAGLAWERGVTGKIVSRKELKAGIAVEMEHTDIPAVARKIALDHLAEFPRYYSALAAMEKGLMQEDA